MTFITLDTFYSNRSKSLSVKYTEYNKMFFVRFRLDVSGTVEVVEYLNYLTNLSGDVMTIN